MLGDDLKPDRVVTAADLARDGVAFPAYYGEDMLLPEGKTPAYLGQAVAMLMFHDFARFRFAKEKLQFNDAVIRYGASPDPCSAIPGALAASCASAARRLRRRRFLPDQAGAGLVPTYASTSQRGRSPHQAMRRAGRAGHVPCQADHDELAQPPADWLVLTRDYSTQSVDTAALEPDNANGWYDAAKQELHMVVPTQSPHEVVEGARDAREGRFALKWLFLHPCYTVGYGSKDHCNFPYYGLWPHCTATAGRCAWPTTATSSSSPPSSATRSHELSHRRSTARPA